LFLEVFIYYLVQLLLGCRPTEDQLFALTSAASNTSM